MAMKKSTEEYIEIHLVMGLSNRTLAEVILELPGAPEDYIGT